MLAYILYFTLESKMIIVGLHIITSRHVFNIFTSKVCILLGASQQTRYGEQWINTQSFEFQKFSQTIELIVRLTGKKIVHLMIKACNFAC